ncbi:MAG: hypothetical protein KAJ55_16990 [Anaerolineales bacterium]|nr:hypothetical protein [Anaerolineales bacterium]
MSVQDKLTWWRKFQDEVVSGKPGKAVKMFDNQMRKVLKDTGGVSDNGKLRATYSTFEDTAHRLARQESGDFADPEYQKYMQKGMRDRGLVIGGN